MPGNEQLLVQRKKLIEPELLRRKLEERKRRKERESKSDQPAGKSTPGK